MNEKLLGMIRDKLNAINENSLYSTPVEYADFLADPNKVADTFMFSFLGVLGAFSGARDKNQIIPYFKKEKKLRPADIGDSNNDISIIAKMLFEKKIIRTSDQFNQITKFLVKMKQGTVTSIDEKYIRDWLNNMRVGFFVQNLSPDTLKVYRAYINDPNENLERLAYRLFKIRNKYKEISGEFTKLAMRAKFAKIPDLDKEYDGASDGQPVASPVIPQAAVSKVVPEISIAPFTTENIYDKLHSMYSDSKSPSPDGNDRNLEMEDVKALNELFVASWIIDEARIKDALGSAWQRQDYSGATRVQFWKNVEAALSKFSDMALASIFINLYTHSMKYDKSAIPKELVEIFKNNKHRLIPPDLNLYKPKNYRDSFKHTALSDLFLEFNDAVFEKLNFYNEAKIVAGKISALPAFKDPVVFANMYLRIFIDYIENRIAHDDSPSIYDFRPFDQISQIAAAQKINYPFRPDPALLRKLTSIVDSLLLSKTLMFPSSFFIETYKRLINYPELWDKSYSDKIISIFKSAFNKAKPELLSVFDFDENADLSPFRSPKEFIQVKAGEFNQFPREIAGDNIIDDIIAALGKRGGINNIDNSTKIQLISMKAADYNMYSNSRKDNIDDPEKEIEWYKSKIKQLGLSDPKEQNSIYRFLFLKGFQGNNPQDKRNEFYLKVLLEMDKLGVAADQWKTQGFDAVGNGRIDTFIFLSALSKNQTLELVKSAVNNPNSIFKLMFSKDALKGMTREQKAEATEFFANVFFDHADSNPDLVDKFYESLDPYQQNKVREKMTSYEILDSSFETGTISFQEKLSSARIKEILSYNNVKVDDLVQEKLPRKSKFDTFSSYNKKIKDAIASSTAKIPEPLVTEEKLSEQEIALKNHQHIRAHYAGRHGNIYPIFKRAFSVHLPVEQYEEFTKRMKDAGIANDQIIPAFHGTGGIGASMILRYGFRVIYDPNLTTGKMLGENQVPMRKKRSSATTNTNSSGAKYVTLVEQLKMSQVEAMKEGWEPYFYDGGQRDPSFDYGYIVSAGVYFSNKIDKACQYVGNSGFTRKKGTLGYIFEMESQLGQKDKNYKAAGLGADQIRSPEWCVFEPNHQLKIMTAYEVELGDADDYKKVQQKGGLNEGTMSFSEFLLNEKTNLKPEEQIRFVFFDNRIILSDRQIYDASEIESYGNDVFIERDVEGTAVTFLYTKTTESYDIAFASRIKQSTLKKFLSLLNSRKNKSGLRLKKKNK